MPLKRYFVIAIVFYLPIMVSAQEIRQVVDSMQYEIRDFRDSIKIEIRDFRDSIRYVRRHSKDSIPHSIRIGWGDQMFEQLLWRDKGHPTVLPPTYTNTYQERFRYTQHWFLEYLYNVNYWYSVGAMVDYSGVLWDEITRDGTGTERGRIKNRHFSNIVIMPVVRFTYYQGDYTSLYSSAGVGLNINTGTEIDYKGRKTALAPAFNFALLGISIGEGHWYGAIELGGMFSLMGSDEVYMLDSRIFTASIGVRL